MNNLFNYRQRLLIVSREGRYSLSTDLNNDDIYVDVFAGGASVETLLGLAGKTLQDVLVAHRNGKYNGR